MGYSGGRWIRGVGYSGGNGKTSIIIKKIRRAGIIGDDAMVGVEVSLKVMKWGGGVVGWKSGVMVEQSGVVEDGVAASFGDSGELSSTSQLAQGHEGHTPGPLP